jgi:hypothetical protein
MMRARSLGVECAAILRVDDPGMCHGGGNAAYLELPARGYVTCGSVMGRVRGFAKSPTRRSTSAFT